MKKALLPAGLAVCLLFPCVASAAGKLNTLLVVPARKQMVQLAFDMQSLRQADVVSWSPASGSEEPLLYYWIGDKWEPLSLDQFRSASYLSRKPQKTIFIGPDTPALLTEAQGSGIARFETFDTAVLVNNLNDFYAFSDGEWRLLSKRYNFVLRDTNAQLREQSRTYQPGPEKTSTRQAPVTFNNPPPATVIQVKLSPVKKTTPAPESKPRTDKPAAKPAAKIESAPVTFKVEPVKVEPVAVTPASEPAAPIESAPVKADVVPPLAVETKPAQAPEANTVIESKPAVAPETK